MNYNTSQTPLTGAILPTVPLTQQESAKLQSQTPLTGAILPTLIPTGAPRFGVGGLKPL